MGTVVKYDNIFQYNESRGVETQHPLVSVIDFSKAEPIPPGHYRHCFGFYAVFLKDVKCGDLRYGRNYYDYQEGTLVFMAPGQVVEVEVKDKPQVPPKGRALLFHPDLLRGTSLGRNIAGYTFFSYEVNEALHLSEQERQVVMDCLQNIQSELKHAIDKHSRTLIVSNIELLLNYSTRFYERQFITRNNVNRDVLAILNKAYIPVRDQNAEAVQRQQQERAKVDVNKLQASRMQAAAQAGQEERQKPMPLHAEKKAGRNDPCPCGSGKKYKNCHGKNL